MKVNKVYSSGRVLRYHCNTDLNMFHQNNADHQWGCAVIMIMLNPKCSKRLLKACILHDCGEKWAGDLPYPFKIRNPEVANKHQETEKQLAKENGVPVISLTKKEKDWLTLVDRLETVLYVQIYKPELLYTSEWSDQNEVIIKLADKLGVYGEVTEIFNG